MASEELKRLRNEVQARHRAATQKVSRLRRISGVELGGTSYDPRVPAADIKRMNKRQAEAHLRNLDRFMDRNNAFRAAANMKPIPIKQARRFRTAESNSFRLGQEQRQRIGEHVMRNGSTLGEAMAVNDTMVQTVGTRRGTMPHIQRKREGLTGIQSLDKLNALTRQIESENSPRYIREQRAKTHKNMMDVLRNSGVRPDLIASAERLTPYQADVLWNYHPSFATNSGLKYDETKRLGHENAGSDADTESWQLEQVEWASSLQEARTQSQSARGRRR